VGKFIRWIVNETGNAAVVSVNFVLTVIIAAILYSKGEVAAYGVTSFAQRVAGARGENATRLAAQAIRAVALGIVVTALIQSALSGMGLAVAGVPYAAFLTALIFILTIAQIGTVPVLICAVIWLYWKGDVGWGTALLVWTLIMGSLDNFLRPILIKRGANLPLLLIFAGVIGGLMAFGIIGIFIGPVVLAVSYTLLVAWVRDADLQTEPLVIPVSQAVSGEDAGKKESPPER
ncbi:MAG TPA: AI-2E family transporter, partial [Thermodesulfobacteriota bacterium]|nr:AI-2E family transporter [Thermodesulfobacteriota bacterium]